MCETFVGKSIWYTDYGAQDISHDTAVLSQVTSPKECSSCTAVHNLQQGQGVDQASGFTSRPSASDNPLTLVMSRKPTIDYNPQKVEENFQQMNGQTSPTYKPSTAARRPSTLDLVPRTTQMDDETATHPAYQWGTMSVVIDKTPGKTTVTIGSTPTPRAQNLSLFPSIGHTNRALGVSVPSLASYSQRQVEPDRTVKTVVKPPALLPRDPTSQRVDSAAASSQLQLTNRNNRIFQPRHDQQSQLAVTQLQSMFRHQVWQTA